MLAWGTCHPRGEDADFDGVYVRRNEMNSMAESLRGKPIYVEHDGNQTGQVGTIHHAWKTKDAKLNILFETDPSCFKGALASRLIRHGVCNELSLGHNCEIKFSQQEMHVGKKTPTEVSIVVKGDRPNTAIRGWVSEDARRSSRSRSQKQDPRHVEDTPQYILNGNASKQNAPFAEIMSSTEPASATETETFDPADTSDVAGEGSETPTEMQELMEQLRAQSELVAKQKLEHETTAKRMSELNERVSKYERVGTERRKRALGGAVKDWVGKMVSTHAKELGPYEAQLKELLGSMQNHEDAEPMVQMLSCAASASAVSTSKLNKAYQDLKDAQQSAKRFKKQYEESQKPAFTDSSQRFKPPSGPDAPSSAPTPAPANTGLYKSMFSNPAVTAAQRGGGLKESHPDLWSAIRTRASAMPSGGFANAGAFDTSMYSKDMQRSFHTR